MSGWGLWFLSFIVLVNTGFIAGIFVALMMVSRKLAELTVQVEPVVRRADETLARVELLTGDLQQRTETILERTAALVERVSQKVDTTTAIAEETISQPLIGAASVMAGISRGLETFREQAGEKGDNV
jgi:uncharacterized protein YoxC